MKKKNEEQDLISRLCCVGSYFFGRICIILYYDKDGDLAFCFGLWRRWGGPAQAQSICVNTEIGAAFRIEYDSVDDDSDSGDDIDHIAYNS
jgi:hypothetical protein